MEEKNNGYTGGESSKENTLHGTRCEHVINLINERAAYKLPKIYKYDSRTRFKHWLAGFKHFAAVTKIKDSQLITVLLTFLCPKSAQRVSTLCLSDVDKSDVNRTLENISKVLEKPNRISVKAKLFKARQKAGQSITEFATKLMDLATDAYPEESQDALRSEILMDVFLTGLKSEYIALSVLSNKPKTFDEAMNSAVDLEFRIAERHGGRNFSDNEVSNNRALSLEDQNEGLALIRCFTCGELGHYEDGCTFKKDNRCHHINQPYSEPESCFFDRNNDDEHYDHGQYYDEKYNNGTFSNFDDENPTDRHYDDRHYDDGQFDDGHYDGGRFDDRHYDDGQFDDRHYDVGRFDDGHYDDGHYDDGNYDDGHFDDGHHDEGTFVDGQYADEYADDADFADEDEDSLREMLPICKEILAEWDLLVNEDKTEFVRFYIAEKDEVDEKGEPVKGREPWRKSVSLGSRLCSKEDITHRCILANVAFEKFQKVWIERSHIAVHTKVRLYEALVTPVLLYNCNSWAAPDNILKKLDVCQRKHLRRILNTTYPHVITNRDLYAR